MFILVSVCGFPHWNRFCINHIALRNINLKVEIFYFYDNPRLSQNYELLYFLADAVLTKQMLGLKWVARFGGYLSKINTQKKNS